MRKSVGLLLLLCAARVWAAGAVVGEPGSCIIEIGIYSAHFTIYQPDSSGNEEFCEDLPKLGNTLFVLDYLHTGLKDVPLDFRIIKDVEGWGIFARWDNISSIDDIDAHTVFYQPPTRQPQDSMTVEHNFLEAGGYIGIITAEHPSKPISYHAVFPFQVGRFNFTPWLLLAIFPGAAGYYLWRRSKRG